MTAVRGWLGVDLGTQSVRARLVDDAGRVLGRGSAPLTSWRDGSRHEQDPESWWIATRAATGDALAESASAGDHVEVSGLAVDGTSGSITLVDPNGIPLVPGLMYDDGRGESTLERVNGLGAELWARLGYHRMQRSWALPKLVALLEEHPELREIATLAHQTDVITRRLVGRPVSTDLSSALKTGANLISGEWPTSLMSALGVPPNLLPDLVLPGERLGTVNASTAEELGIPAGVPVVAGMTDGCAGQLASGATGIGDWNSILGTTLVLKGSTSVLIGDANGSLYSHRGTGGTWLPGGASSSGAGVVSELFAGHDLQQLTARAMEDDDSSITYPLVSPGERFPFVAPQARRFTVGEPDTLAQQFGAVLRGVAYVERLAFDYVASLGAQMEGTLSLTGGAVRNREWCQLRVDVLGRPAAIPVQAEPSLGMAVLAAASIGGVSLQETASRMVHVADTLEPRSGEAGRHREGYFRLVHELESRGWLPKDIADSARRWSAA